MDVVRLLLDTANQANQKLLENILLQKDAVGHTPLHAAFNNQPQVFNEILTTILSKAQQQKQLITALFESDRTGMLTLIQANIIEDTQLLRDILEEPPMIANSDNPKRKMMTQLIREVLILDESTINDVLLSREKHTKNTPLHKASSEADDSTVSLILKKAKRKGLLTLQDVLLAVNKNGEIPLHVASKNDKGGVIKLMMQMDSVLQQNETTGDEEAARSSETESTVLKWKMLIAKENQGFTPLDLAHKNECEKAGEKLKEFTDKEVTYLLHVTIQDWEKSKHAAQTHPKRGKQLYLDLCIGIGSGDAVDKWLVELYRKFQEGQKGNHSEDYDEEMKFWKEALKLVSPELAVKHLPDTVGMVLDASLIGVEQGKKVRMNFGTLKTLQKNETRTFLDLIVEEFDSKGDLSYDKFLSHPVVEQIIEIKWRKIGKIWFWLSLLMFFSFLVMLIFTAYPTAKIPNDIGELIAKNETDNIEYPTDTEITTLEIVLFTMSLLRLAGEIFDFIYSINGFSGTEGVEKHAQKSGCQKEGKGYFQNLKSYFSNIDNVTELILYISTIVYVWSGDYLWCKKMFAFVAVTSGLWNMFLIFRYFPGIGIYYIMFLRILKTFLLIIPQMAFCLVSFTIVFTFAINDDMVNFTSGGKSYYWVWTRFFSSLEYDVININDEERSVYLALFTFFLFGLLINLILFNLVTGLAIDDVQKIRTESEKQEKVGKIKMISIGEKICFYLSKVTHIAIFKRIPALRQPTDIPIKDFSDEGITKMYAIISGKFYNNLDNGKVKLQEEVKKLSDENVNILLQMAQAMTVHRT
eukprot:sb/3462171/